MDLDNRPGGIAALPNDGTGGDLMQLKPMEPPSSNDFCFLCMYGSSDSHEAQSLIEGVRRLISSGMHKRNVNDIIKDVQAYYNDSIREHVDNQPAWTLESIRRHILHTETDAGMATELDLRTCIQMLQHLRENMRDEVGQLYGPNLNHYLRVSGHLQRIMDMRAKR